MNSELSMDQALIEKLKKILEDNLEREHFGVKELAKEAGLSRSQLNRKLQAILGKSTCRFIREYRLEKAMGMLQNNEATASEIAYRVGFNSPTYFNTCFNQFYGYPPGEAKFRKTSANQQTESIDTPLQLSARIKTIRTFNRRLVWINTIAILLLGVLGFSLYQTYVKPQNDMAFSMKGDKSIAILPFKNLSEDPENQFFADGISGTIQANLNKITDLRVISSFSMEKYRHTTLTAEEIAKDVNVEYLLNGSVLKHGDSIRVLTNLINAKTNEIVTSSVFDWEYKNIFEIQRRIASDIVNELEVAIDPEKLEIIQTNPTKNLEAYILYLKGRFFWHRRTKEGINKSIDYFNQAIALDSTYALAYAGLADAYFVMPWYIRVKDKDSVFTIAKDYAEKTLYLDKNNAQAHATLGGIFCFKDWNWEASEKELKLAIQLNPNYATAHQYYAELLEILGRAKEARKEIDLALSLNPISYVMTVISSRLYYQDGLYEKAIIEANKAKEFNNKSGGAYDIIINCYTYMGRDDEAMAEWEEGLKLYPDKNIEVTEGRRDAFKKSGIKGALKFQHDLRINSDNADRWKMYIAGNYAYLGETEKALEWLELAYKKRGAIYRMKSNPKFKSLRKEPRFLALLDKLNLGGYDD